MLKLDAAYDIAHSTPIQNLADLWAVKYGNEWVSVLDLDFFYLVVSSRLFAVDMLEKHSVPTHFNDVYRLKEKQGLNGTHRV